MLPLRFSIFQFHLRRFFIFPLPFKLRGNTKHSGEGAGAGGSGFVRFIFFFFSGDYFLADYCGLASVRLVHQGSSSMPATCAWCSTQTHEAHNGGNGGACVQETPRSLQILHECVRCLSVHCLDSNGSHYYIKRGIDTNGRRGSCCKKITTTNTQASHVTCPGAVVTRDILQQTHTETPRRPARRQARQQKSRS